MAASDFTTAGLVMSCPGKVSCLTCGNIFNTPNRKKNRICPGCASNNKTIKLPRLVSLRQLSIPDGAGEDVTFFL
jgi:hypothetical protein